MQASIREQTLKSILPMASKLNERNINNELLRFLGKLQTDDQPGIRTVSVFAILDNFELNLTDFRMRPSASERSANT